jgi:hypothetical protein
VGLGACGLDDLDDGVHARRLEARAELPVLGADAVDDGRPSATPMAGRLREPAATEAPCPTPSIRFMDGLPMKPATKVFWGRS